MLGIIEVCFCPVLVFVTPDFSLALMCTFKWEPPRCLNVNVLDNEDCIAVPYLSKNLAKAKITKQCSSFSKTRIAKW